MREESTKRAYITNAQVVGPYSPGVQVGNLLFVSGQIGINQKLELVSDSIEGQTRQALLNLLNILKQAGCDSSSVVSCTVYLKDIKDFPKMNLIYGGFFQEGKYPARATIEAANLPKNARVEIACIAVKM
ncbi:MAG: RidA family protein [Ignavibacteriales bacterium]|nr:RidA family protein [Ignavibacteriales bacterium]